MFKKMNWRNIFPAATIAALFFCFFAFLFIQQAEYSSTWLLYLGSICFFFSITAFSIFRKAEKRNDETTTTPIFEGLVTTGTGIIISCLIVFILLLILMPGFIESVPATHVLQGEPAAGIAGKTNGLVFKVFFAATLLNFFGGSIASIIMAFYIKSKTIKI
ncbi:MAG: hypothetical protein ABIP30_07005 [Ferruginibacter sp.]